MDFPKSVPSVGLVDGKFIDEDPLAGTPGSLIPSEWGNSVTLEILQVIQDGGLVPDEDDKTQLSVAIHNIVSGSVVPFATKAEAEDGTINDKSMSPLRVFQAIAKVVNQATEGAFGWLKIGAQAQVNAGADDAVAITPKKLAAATQVQAHTAFTSAGTSTALTLAPSPAITAYAVNQRFSVKFHASSGINPTLNVSGKGPKNLKQYDSTGAKVAAVFASDQVGDVIYDGLDLVLIDQLPATSIQRPQGLRGAAVNWKASASGTSGNIVCSADSVIVVNAAGDPSAATAVAATLNTTVAASATVDGMASGPTVANTWYGIYVWTNAAGVKRVTGDSAYTSGLAPTAPAAGFDSWAFRSAFKTDNTASKNPLRFYQTGDSFELSKLAGSNVAALPLAASGSTGSVVTAVNLAGLIPPSATKVKVSAYTPGDASSRTFAMPSTSYDISDYAGGSGPSVVGYFVTAILVEILLQGVTTIAWSSAGANSKLTLLGWEL